MKSVSRRASVSSKQQEHGSDVNATHQAMAIDDVSAFAWVRHDRRATIRLLRIRKIRLGRHVGADTASGSDLLLPGFPPSAKEDRLPREVL